MLPTQKIMQMVMEMSDNTADMVLNRRGVCSKVIIPNAALRDDMVNIDFGLNREEKVILLKSGDGLVTVTDELGIGKFTNIDILFINSNLACVELKSGCLYLKNAKGIEYGLDDGCHLLRDTSNVCWVTIQALFKICKSKIVGAYHTDEADAENYIYNAVFNMTLTHEVYSPATAKRAGCYSTTTYVVSAIYNTIALGEFEFTVFEKVAPVKRSYMDAIWGKSKDEEEMYEDLTEQDALKAHEAMEDAGVAQLFSEDDGEPLDGLYDDMLDEDEEDGDWFE